MLGKLIKSKEFLIIFILIIAHAWQLTKIPVAFHPDEKVYLANAAVLSQFGTDVSGNWRPWQLRPFHSMFAELPSVMFAPAFLFFSDPFSAAKITSLLIGLCSAFLLALLAKNLTKRKTAFWPVLFVALANPWLWQLTRTSFDPIFSIFFYLAAINLMFVKSGWRWLAPIAWFLGFYQYQGLKIIFLPLLFSILLYQWWTNKREGCLDKKNKLFPLTIGVFGLAVFVFYTFVALPRQGAIDRVNNDTILSADFRQEISRAVGDERRIALLSPVQKMFSNKFSVAYFQIWQKWINLIRLDYMFVSNDPSLSGFSVWSHGLFYPLDAILILIGLFWIWKKKERLPIYLILAWLAIGTLPSLITFSNSWFMFRLSWFYVSLILLIGLGVERVLLSTKKIKVVFFAFYLMLIANFTYQFFVRYPVYSTNGNRFGERVLVEYLYRVGVDQATLVNSQEKTNLVLSYLLYNWPRLNTAQKRDVMSAYNQVTPEIDQVRFIHDCLSPDDLNNQATLIIFQDVTWCDKVEVTPELKKQFSQHLSISSVLDAGEQIYIFNDQLCHVYQLNAYPQADRIEDYNLSAMSDQEFCQTWIQDLQTLRP